MTLKSPALLFDLDGTLVDTASDLLLALNAVLTCKDRRPVNLTTLKAMVGGGVRTLLQRAFEAAGTALTAQELAELEASFLAEYEQHLTANSRPFPHVQETLEALRQTGARLAVLTNKSQNLAQRLLKAMNLSVYFFVIRGAKTSHPIKPDAGVVEALITELGGIGSGAVLIGDSVTDVKTGRAAKIPVVLVSYGYSARSAVELGADVVIADFSQLPAAIRCQLG